MLSPNFLTRFRTRLVLLIFLVGLPAVALVLYGHLEQRRLEKTRAREGAIAISRLAAANEDNYVKNTRQLLGTLSQLSFLVLSKDRAFCHTGFANLRKLSSDYADFGLIESNGTLFCSSEISNTPNIKVDAPYVQRVSRTKTFSLIGFQTRQAPEESLLNFGYPVMNERGELARVLYASLRGSLLSEAISNIGLPEAGSVTVIDRKGAIVARQPDPEKWVGKTLNNEPMVKRVLANNEAAFEMPGLDGVKRLYAVSVVPEGQSPELFVNVGIPVTISFVHLNEILFRNLLILALVGSAVWLVAWSYARRHFLRPINDLGAAANRIASGDFSARINPTEGTTELVQLGRAFDEMAERVEQRGAEINRLNQDLENRVTERTSQLKAANEELEAFSYSVSHDLRSPLRHIGGFTRLLKAHLGESLDDEGKRLLKTVGDSTTRMGVLIDDLLAFSRMSRTQMTSTEVNFNSLVEEVIESLQETNERNIEWKLQPLPKVKGDRALLRQVLVNLISNALKYSRGRNPAIIEIGHSTAENGEVVIFVRDNGVGFDPAYAHNLFGVFQRLHDASEFEGTGIGLANVRRIITRHHGRTWADGRPGEGATFYISLPNSSNGTL